MSVDPATGAYTILALEEPSATILGWMHLDESAPPLAPEVVEATDAAAGSSGAVRATNTGRAAARSTDASK